MGIDPGVANTGFGVVRVAGGAMSAVDGGVIDAPAELDPAGRLARIRGALQLIAWHEPAAVALEDLYRRRTCARRSASSRPAGSQCWRPPSAAFPASTTRRRP